MKKIKLILLFFIGVSVVFADNLDSLYRIVEIETGEIKTQNRLQISYLLRKKDFSEAVRQGKIAYKEALDLKNIDFQATAYYYLGLAYNYKSIPDSALIYFKKSAKLYKDTKNNDKLGKIYSFIGATHLGLTGNQKEAINYFNTGINYAKKGPCYLTLAMIYSHISNIYRMNGSYKKSMEYIFKSKENYELANFDEGIAWISYSIGRLYDTMHLYSEAQKAFLEALERYRRLDSDIEKWRGEAICYDELALVNIELKDLILAREYNQLAIETYKKTGSEFGLSNAYKYKARIEFVSNNFYQAKDYLDMALNIKKEMDDALGLPGVYTLYGKFFIKHEEYQRAIDSLMIGLNYARSNDQKNNQIKLNKELTRAYDALNDIESAYYYQGKHLDLADSVYHSKVTRNVTQLEAIYQNEANERIIQELEHENLINELSLFREKNLRKFLLIIIVLVLIFSFIVAVAYRRLKQVNIALSESETRLKEMNAGKDKFFSLIAHDLKTPFNTLIGFSGLMLSYSRDKEYDKVDEFSKYIYDTSKQTFDFLENLLEWSRIQTNKTVFNPEMLNVYDLLQEAEGIIFPQAVKKKIDINLQHRDIDIFVDKNMMLKVLHNILSNAVKYSHRENEINIRLREDEINVHISIEDNGIGLKKDEIKKIFRLDESFRKEGTEGEMGTGLGLILAKEFVSKNHGHIRVDSSPGRGSTFTITLPKA